METTTGKSPHGGNYAQTRVNMGSGRILTVSTQKRCGGYISSAARCSQVNGEFETWLPIGDFIHHFPTRSHKAATLKEVQRVHNIALLALPEVQAAASSFYNTKGA